jgi:glycosyltransferase involved in cell wall biosynthesis
MGTSEIGVTVVGPEASRSGGMSQYVRQQRQHLKAHLDLTVHSVATIRSDSNRLTAYLWLYLVAVMRSLLEMVRFTRRQPTDIVHVHTAHSFESLRSMFYVWYSSTIWGSTVVIHVHGSSYDEFVKTDSLVLEWFQSRLFARADSVIVISQRLRDTLSTRIPAEKMVVLPNAVSPGKYDPRSEFDPPRLVFLTSHVERKGIRELEATIHSLSNRQVRFDVDLAGTGPLAERSRRLALQYDHVTYHGYVSESKKRRLLERGAIFVLPSRAECLPFAILEAMAGGTAVVTTAVGGIPEVVTEEHGRLVPPESPAQLTETLVALLEKSDLIDQMGRRNRRLVTNHYAWERVAGRLLAHYEELVDSVSDQIGVGQLQQ